jgi:putative transposase
LTLERFPTTTAHPTAEWTVQQLRIVVLGDQTHRFVIHDRDTIYSEQVDRSREAMGLAVLKRRPSS